MSSNNDSRMSSFLDDNTSGSVGTLIGEIRREEINHELHSSQKKTSIDLGLQSQLGSLNAIASNCQDNSLLVTPGKGDVDKRGVASNMATASSKKSSGEKLKATGNKETPNFQELSDSSLESDITTNLKSSAFSKQAMKKTSNCKRKITDFQDAVDSSNNSDLTETDVSNFIAHTKKSGFCKQVIKKTCSGKENINFEDAFDSTADSDLTDVTNTLQTANTANPGKTATKKRSFLSKPKYQSLEDEFNEIREALDSSKSSDTNNIPHCSGNQKQILRSRKTKNYYQMVLDASTDVDVSVDYNKLSAFCRKPKTAKESSKRKNNFQAVLDSTADTDISDVIPMKSGFRNFAKKARSNINSNAFEKALESSAEVSNIQLNQSNTNGVDVKSDEENQEEQIIGRRLSTDARVMENVQNEVANVLNADQNLPSTNEMSRNSATSDLKKNENASREGSPDVSNSKDMTTSTSDKCNSTNFEINNKDNQKPTSENSLMPLIVPELQLNRNPNDIEIATVNKSKMSVSSLRHSATHDYTIMSRSVSQNCSLLMSSTMQNSEVASGSSLHISHDDQTPANSMFLSVTNVSNVNKSLTQPSAILNIQSDYDSMLSSSESSDESDAVEEDQCNGIESKSSNNNSLVDNVVEEDQCDGIESKSSNDNSSVDNRYKSTNRNSSSSSFKAPTELATIDKSKLSSLSVSTAERIAQMNENYDSMETTTDSVLAENSDTSKTVNSTNNVITNNTEERSGKNRSKRGTLQSSQRNFSENYDSLEITTDSVMAENSDTSKTVNTTDNVNTNNPEELAQKKQSYSLRRRSSNNIVQINDVVEENIEAASDEQIENLNVSKERSGKNRSKRGTPRSSQRNLCEVLQQVPLSELRNNKYGQAKKTLNHDCDVLNDMLTFPKETRSNRNEILRARNRNSEVEEHHYKRPKLQKPKPFATNRLYKFIIDKLTSKYGIKSNKRAEKFVIYLCNTVTNVGKLSVKDEYRKQVDLLMIEMARLQVVDTYFDFYTFVHDYLPYSFVRKSVPTLIPFNQEPLVDAPPQEKVFTSIL